MKFYYVGKVSNFFQHFLDTKTLSHFHTLTLSLSNTFTISHFHTSTLSHVHIFTHSHSHSFIISHSHNLAFSHSHTCTLSHSHPFTHRRRSVRNAVRPITFPIIRHFRTNHVSICPPRESALCSPQFVTLMGFVLVYFLLLLLLILFLLPFRAKGS